MKKSNKQLLIVGAHKEQRNDLVQFLSGKYELSEAKDISEAHEILFNGNKPDIVITDVCLSESDSTNCDGLLLLEKIHIRFPLMPVIVITDGGAEQYIDSRKKGKKADAYSLGAYKVLSKPFKLKELEYIIVSALQKEAVGWKGKVRRVLHNWIPPILMFILFLVLWEVLCKYFNIKEYIIPAPSKVGTIIISQFGSLIKDTGITMVEAVLGFLLANILSIIIAVGFCHSRWFERSFYPYTIALKSVPVIAIAPLLVLWFGYGLLSKVIMAAIISFFPLVVNATLGLKSVDSEALDLMKSLSASRMQILLKLRFPNALPYMFSALKISSALSVVGAIVGELTGAKEGIGFAILISSYNVDTPMLFAAIIAASLAGILFFALVALIENIIFKKYGFHEII